MKVISVLVLVLLSLFLLGASCLSEEENTAHLTVVTSTALNASIVINGWVYDYVGPIRKTFSWNGDAPFQVDIQASFAYADFDGWHIRDYETTLYLVNGDDKELVITMGMYQ
jgi:hypothetical protein